jgi:large subunit ribosomal protein L2
MYAEVFQFYHDFWDFNKKVIIMLKKVFSKNSEVLFKNRVNFIFKFVAKRLNFGLISYGGRNFNGRICVYHRGGGNKRIFRSIDRFRRLNQVGTIMRLFKFPIFSALVGFIIYDNGLSSFIILSSKVREGSRVFSGIFSDVNNKKNYKNVSFSLGSTMLLEKVSLFSQINSIEVAPTKGFVLARAAGTSAFLTSREINDRV